MRPITILLILWLIPLSLPLALSDASSVEVRIQQSNGQPAVKEFLIIVSRNGFNGSRDLKVVVEQGDIIRLKFMYGDDDLQIDNPHRIEIPEYGIVVRLNRDSKSGEVELTANKPGAFKIRCTLRCRGHENLQEGLLEVRPSSQAVKHVRLSPWMVPSQSGYLIGAVASLENGEPAEGVLIEFLVETSFGMVSLGSATTDHSGNASLLYKPPSAGRYIIHVVAGGGDLTQSNVTLALVSSKGFSPLELPQTNVVSQNYWPDPRLVGAPIEANTVLIVLVSSVVMTAWGIILYTVWTLSRIKSEDKENGRAF